MIKNIKLFRVILIAGILSISCMPATGQIDENYWENHNKAFSASSIIECQSSLKFCNEVLKITPNHPVMNYLAARLNEQLGCSAIALKYLKKAVKLGYTSDVRWRRFHPMNDPAFSALRGKKEFQEIIEIMKNSEKPIHNSEIAFTVNKKKLGKSGSYEGITYDPVEKMFYLGSDHKIVKVDPSGNCIDFIKGTEQDGLGLINGVHVDPVCRTLWACSFVPNSISEIFKYSLSSGKLIKKYPAPSDGFRHVFNDLVIHPNGDVYISDTSWGGIYLIPYSSDTLELFLKNKSIVHPNGITLSGDGRFIFVALISLGICKIEIKTKACVLLTHEQDFTTYTIDGLYFSDNYLYAIQNNFLCQVSRFSLNKDTTHLESCEILEKNTHNLRAPTTGVLVDDYFYFIADTQGKGGSLNRVVVMKAPIGKPNPIN